VLRIKGSRRGLALKVDSNPRACAIDPYLGTVATVCEAARNIACVGARPVALTNCLNYGNPERPEIMWQFERAVAGLRDTARALGTPVVSGNVSFYNETEGRAIAPTPVVAMVGTLEMVDQYLDHYFKFAGDAILMIQTAPPALCASEYAALFAHDGDIILPIDLSRERMLVEGLVEAAKSRLIRSAHDVSQGGLAVALVEACFNPGAQIGVSVILDDQSARALFGEGASTVVVSVSPANLARVKQIFAPLECRQIGQVNSSPRLRIGSLIDENIGELIKLYEEALPRRIDEQWPRATNSQS